MDSKGLTNRDRKHVTSQSQTDDAAAAFWKKGCCSMQRESLCLVKINVVKTVRDIWYCPLPLWEYSSFFSSGKVFSTFCDVAGVMHVCGRCTAIVACSVHNYMWKNSLFGEFSLSYFRKLNENFLFWLTMMQRLKQLYYLFSNSLLSCWMRFIHT